MLRVTIELLPGGREASARVLSVAHIRNKGRSKRGSHYGIRLGSEDPGIDHKAQAYEDGNRTGELLHYPRWSASIWDLVARALQRTLRESPKSQTLGPFPKAIASMVPVLKSGDITYVRYQDMPDFVRLHFMAFMDHKTCPLIEEEQDPRGCAYSWDWNSFLGV